MDSDLVNAVHVAKYITEHDFVTTLRDFTVPIECLYTIRQDGWKAVINLGCVLQKSTSKLRQISSVHHMVSVT